MARILVLYYSSYGHIMEMAEAVAEGARSALAHVDVPGPSSCRRRWRRKAGYGSTSPTPRPGRGSSQLRCVVTESAPARRWPADGQIPRRRGPVARCAGGQAWLPFTSTAPHGARDDLVATHTNPPFRNACVGLPTASSARFCSTRSPRNPYGASTIAAARSPPWPTIDAKLPGRHVADSPPAGPGGAGASREKLPAVRCLIPPPISSRAGSPSRGPRVQDVCPLLSLSGRRAT